MEYTALNNGVKMPVAGIVIQAWYPLGHGDKALIQEPLFAGLGK